MTRLAINGGTPVRSRPFPEWPVFDHHEENAVLGLLRSGDWWKNACGEVTAPGAPKSKAAEFGRGFAARHNTQFGIACTNGSAAIEIALKALGIGPGDEVIVPPYTFIATATAPLNIGAVPVFVDIHPETLNIDPNCIEQAITPRTRAVVPVHFAGAAADMEAILAIARKHGLAVIEDAAHGHGGTWNHQALGSIGDAGTFSFQFSKNMTAGEGGVIITNSKDLALLCESYVWGGREPARPWYEHHRLGWNARMTEFQAVILLEQLRRLDAQAGRRSESGLLLNSALASIPGIHPLCIPDYVTGHAFHIYIFRFDEHAFGASRADFLAGLAAEGIPASSGYAHPLYRNPMFLEGRFNAPGAAKHAANSLDYRTFCRLCPQAEEACRCAVWLEHRFLLGNRLDVRDIVDAISKLHECRQELSGCAEKQSAAV